jgi:2-amino-4-hydroxy-6-hydroxymethyldihydropteridine diphosphokinase
VDAVAPVTAHRSPVTAYVALGSNLEDPVSQVRAGLRALAALPRTRLIAASSLYRNPPAGYRDQPDFVNAVAQIETHLAPRALLDALLAIERSHGRLRDFPNAPRTLDLDILIYGEKVVCETGLTIPHPRMLERAFVLVPLAEIAPAAVVPGRGCVAELVTRMDATGLVRLANARTANRQDLHD